MLVTVVVCTWNRAKRLERGLAAMERLAVPPGCEWELVVVDNGSTDATGAVLARFAGRLPLRVVNEPRLGLSRARNTGVDTARGELLLFTDDDTRVGDAWLSAYVGAAARWTHAVFFGGRVEAEFEAVPPRWVLANLPALRPMLCTVDVSGEERPMGDTDQPFGPNMAFRREALEGIRFDERLGRRGNEQVRGSEVSVVNELRRRGARGVWVPSAWVEHAVPPQSLNLRYLWRYHEGAGVTAVRLSPERLAGVSAPLGVCKGLAAAALKLLAGRRDWVVHLGRAAHYVGVRREIRRQSRMVAV